jgi:antitoxin (DNA-binding transcriptional repressor) of toxin-antitoxin stability system
MITMTVTEFARNLSGMLDRMEFASEEISLVRNKHVVARVIPGSSVMSARDAFSDIYGCLSDEEGEAWLRDCRGADGTLQEELSDPWA